MPLDQDFTILSPDPTRFRVTAPERNKLLSHMTTPELDAIRFSRVSILFYGTSLEEELTGQSSAASFPTGPVIADPFISPFGLTIYEKSISDLLQTSPA